MGRTAYAFRDLDEELHDGFIDVYETHCSPPQGHNKICTSRNLTDSMVLKQYVDHQRAQRRRKMLGGALFVGAALLGAMPLIIQSQAGDAEVSDLELVLAAPYQSLRTGGDLHQRYSSPVEEEDLRIARPDELEPTVGDDDPHDSELLVEIDEVSGLIENNELHPNDGEGEDEDSDEEQAYNEPVEAATLLRIENADDANEEADSEVLP